GGATTFRNGQGLCESCDYTKQAPGWTAEPVPAAPPGQPAGTPHDVVTTTPTGHRYRSPTPSRVAPATAGSGATVPTVALYLPPVAGEVVLAAGSVTEPARAVATPASITPPPTNWGRPGTSPASTQAANTANTTSVSATKLASWAPNRRAASSPVPYASTV